MGTQKLSTWIKGGITRHNNLDYLQFKLHPEIDPLCRLRSQANETFHHFMTDCKASTSLQIDIMKNTIPLPDMTWSVKILSTFLEAPHIHQFMLYDIHYNDRDIEFLVHNYSSDASSLSSTTLSWPSVGRQRVGCLGKHWWSNNPPPLARTMPSRLFKHRWAS